MLYGHGTSTARRRCLHVNNKGFISLYALLLLLIFLCFLAFFLQRVAAFSSVHELQ